MLHRLAAVASSAALLCVPLWAGCLSEGERGVLDDTTVPPSDTTADTDAGLECPPCDTSDPCIDSWCDRNTGTCQYAPVGQLPEPNECSSDGQCFMGNVCAVGKCVTRDGTCGRVQRVCEYTPAPDCQECETATGCDDGDPCTQDACVHTEFAATCTHQRIAGCTTPCQLAGCDDDDPCTADVCLDDGSCAHRAELGCVSQCNGHGISPVSDVYYNGVYSGAVKLAGRIEMSEMWTCSSANSCNCTAPPALRESGLEIALTARHGDSDVWTCDLDGDCDESWAGCSPAHHGGKYWIWGDPDSSMHFAAPGGDRAPQFLPDAGSSSDAGSPSDASPSSDASPQDAGAFDPCPPDVCGSGDTSTSADIPPRPDTGNAPPMPIMDRLLVAGFCLQTRADALTGRYEGNLESGELRAPFTATATLRSDQTTLLLEIHPIPCTACLDSDPGWVHPLGTGPLLAIVSPGDGWVELDLSFPMYGLTATIEARLYSNRNQLVGGASSSWGYPSGSGSDGVVAPLLGPNARLTLTKLP